MKKMNLKNKTVLITGGARGIGAEVARVAAARGAHLVLFDLDGDTAEEVAASLPGEHLGIGGDVTDSERLEYAVDQAVARFGGLDVVVANAGIGEAGTVATRPIDALLRTIDINLSAAVRTVHAALPHIIERRGYVLLVSSAAALKNVPGGSCYAASKAGVEYFGGALRLEVAHKGVDVGVIHPAWVRTEMFAKQQQLDSFNEGFKSLPWPFNVVTDVRTCARIFVRAIERRQRKAYVPRLLRALDVVRGVFTGWAWDLAAKPAAARAVPAMEAEIAAKSAENRAAGGNPRL